jgi:hypothetical protein
MIQNLSTCTSNCCGQNSHKTFLLFLHVCFRAHFFQLRVTSLTVITEPCRVVRRRNPSLTWNSSGFTLCVSMPVHSFYLECFNVPKTDSTNTKTSKFMTVRVHVQVNTQMTLDLRRTVSFKVNLFLIVQFTNSFKRVSDTSGAFCRAQNRLYRQR